jgi:hypothetical protein
MIRHVDQVLERENAHIQCCSYFSPTHDGRAFYCCSCWGTVQAQTPEEITALNAQIELLIQRISQLKNTPSTPLQPAIQKAQLDMLTQTIEALKLRIAIIEEAQAARKFDGRNPDPTGNLMDGLLTAGDAPR